MEVVSLTYRKPLSGRVDHVALGILEYLADGTWRSAINIGNNAYDSGGVTAVASYLALQRLCGARRVESGVVDGNMVYRLRSGGL